MKKEYIKPEAEKVVFDYSENVTASRTYTTSEKTMNEYYMCADRYTFNDSVEICGQDGHDVTHEYWLCNLK